MEFNFAVPGSRIHETIIADSFQDAARFYRQRQPTAKIVSISTFVRDNGRIMVNKIGDFNMDQLIAKIEGDDLRATVEKARPKGTLSLSRKNRGGRL